MILSLLVATSLSAIITHANIEQIRSNVKDGLTYVFAVSTSDFEYPRILKSFQNAVQLSKIDAKFNIIDIDDEKITPDMFNISQFPAIVFERNGKFRNALLRGFEEETILGFMNNNAVSKPKTIETKEELKEYYSNTANALIIADDNADHKIFDEYMINNYFEIDVVYAKEALFGKKGFYIYKYIDSTLSELPDLNGKDGAEITDILNSYFSFEFNKINSFVSDYYLEHKQMFVVLMLEMEDFYLTEENIELARKIKDETGLNVTYSDIENSQYLSIRYGLPDSLDSTLAVIDNTGSREFKYMINDKLTAENAIKFINDVKDGKAKKYWKSDRNEGFRKKNNLTSISANDLIDMIEMKKSFVLSLYYSSIDILEPYLNASEILKQTNKDITFGKFSLLVNDWPLDLPKGDEIPYFFVYVKGQKVYEGNLEQKTEVIVQKLQELLNKNLEL